VRSMRWTAELFELLGCQSAQHECGHERVHWRLGKCKRKKECRLDHVSWVARVRRLSHAITSEAIEAFASNLSPQSPQLTFEMGEAGLSSHVFCKSHSEKLRSSDRLEWS